MERGEGCWVTDVDGNPSWTSLPASRSSTTGHSHPEGRRGDRGAGQALHSHVGHRLLLPARRSSWPNGWRRRSCRARPAKVFFTNSGAEAIEGAMKLARYATGRPSYIAFIGGFHGRTFGALSLTASKASQRRRFAPLLSSVFHAPFPSALARRDDGRDALPGSRSFSPRSPRRRASPQFSSSRSRVRAGISCRPTTSCRDCGS